MSPLTDIYNLKGNRVKRIKDGKDDKKIVLTDSNKEADVKNAIANNHIIDAPSDKVVKKMDKVFSKTKKDGNEHGFVVAEDGESSKIVTDGKKGELKESLNKEIYEMTKTKKVAYDVHSHPTGEVQDDGTYTGGPASSPKDKESMKGRTQPSVILAEKLSRSTSQIRTSTSGNGSIKRTKVISFYNQSGNIKTVDYRKFKNAVRKINKKK